MSALSEQCIDVGPDDGRAIIDIKPDGTVVREGDNG